MVKAKTDGATALKDKQNDRETVKEAAGLSDAEAKSLNDDTVKEGAENVREGRGPNDSGEGSGSNVTDVRGGSSIVPQPGDIQHVLDAVKALNARLDDLEKRPAGVTVSPHDPKAHQQRQVDGVVEQARGFNERLRKAEALIESLKAEAPYVLREAEKVQGMVHGSVDTLPKVIF